MQVYDGAFACGLTGNSGTEGDLDGKGDFGTEGDFGGWPPPRQHSYRYV